MEDRQVVAECMKVLRELFKEQVTLDTGCCCCCFYYSNRF
ncbi:hypothetical protein EYF80_067986 [Liparis tanakae]|uniref:Uncharacterized protein n=1 Tax=Liparis tanakae TaxID=230148 RepID=A0A4Z2E0I3_9TELE|nr:hypothetical protein EYF80_067986 [Liparis tanakae]